jgi:hypothetical protein
MIDTSLMIAGQVRCEDAATVLLTESVPTEELLCSFLLNM